MLRCHGGTMPWCQWVSEFQDSVDNMAPTLLEGEIIKIILAKFWLPMTPNLPLRICASMATSSLHVDPSIGAVIKKKNRKNFSKIKI
jgi:hypothetical protein